MSQHEVMVAAPFRPLVGGRSSVSVEGDTVREVLANLVAASPRLEDRLFDGTALHRAVLVFAGDTEVRCLQGLDTVVAPGLKIRILLALSGG